MKRNILFLLTGIWSLVLLAKEPVKVYDAVVAADGSGDYTSVQAAIDAVPDGNGQPYLILVKAGTYREHVLIPKGKNHICLVGEGAERVAISDSQVSGGPQAVPVDQGATVVVHANDITFEGISFVNAHGVENQSGPQALALYAKGDRIALNRCAIKSYQDTYRTSNKENGRNYVTRSLILGAVDFIYGNGNAWIEDCTIQVNRKSGGWIVAPKHSPKTRWGYVFSNCTLTADGIPSETSILLGRPWNYEPKTVFLNTRSEITIPAEGWCPHMGGLPQVFAEYNTMDAQGRPLDLSKRIDRYWKLDQKNDTVWCTAKKMLTEEEAAQYTLEAVMGGDDHWQPELLFAPADQPIGYAIFKEGRLTSVVRKLSWRYRKSAYQVKPINRYGCFQESK
ncbi:MAG: hypothetical protein IJP70_05560 [Bacteroidales bacterium]|nr:hypothetical protein [Bacteroidales bacterium]